MFSAARFTLFIFTATLLVSISVAVPQSRSNTGPPSRWQKNDIPHLGGSHDSDESDRSVSSHIDPRDAQRYGPAPNETLLSYAQKNCSQCLAREEAKISRIEQIKRDLLEKLGLKQVPNVTRGDLPSIPSGPLDGILKNYGYSSDQPYRYPDYDTDFHAKTERIYVFAKKSKRECFSFPYLSFFMFVTPEYRTKN